MNHHVILVWLVCVIASCSANAATVWSINPITFTKADNVDWTQAANQDLIVPQVAITQFHT